MKWLYLLLICFAFPVAAMAQSREVFIYYANETAPEGRELENMNVFTSWLRESEIEKALKQASAIEDDASRFPQVVNEEIAILFRNAASSDTPIAVFTNRSTRDGWFRVLDPAVDDAPKRIDFEPIKSDNYLETANPLAQSAGLYAALQATAKRFDPATHEFVLVTKSHGSSTQPLTLRLPRRHETINREMLHASLRGEEVKVPPLKLGTSQAEYFAALREAGEKLRMSFSLVFIESCRGEFDLETAQQLPDNVACCFASGNRYLHYQTLDYDDLFESAKPNGNLSEAMSDFLKPRYLSMFHKEPMVPRGVWIGFACVCAFWIAWRFRIRRSVRSDPVLSSDGK